MANHLGLGHVLISPAARVGVPICNALRRKPAIEVGRVDWHGRVLGRRVAHEPRAADLSSLLARMALLSAEAAVIAAATAAGSDRAARARHCGGAVDDSQQSGLPSPDIHSRQLRL